MRADSSMAKGDYAAVICDLAPEGSSAPVRALLIRQDGQWKVLSQFWGKRHSGYPVAADQKENLAAVEAWAEKETAKE